MNHRLKAIILILVSFCSKELLAQKQEVSSSDIGKDMKILLAANKQFLYDTTKCYIYKESYFINTIIAYKNLNQLDSMSKYVNEYYQFSPISFWDRFCMEDTPNYFKEIIKKDTTNHWKEKCNLVKQGFDSSLMQKLIQIEIEDQRYRKEIEEISHSNSDPSIKYTVDLIRKQSILDSINQIFIDSVLNCCGYPGRNKVGIILEKVPFMVIQHASVEKMEKYLPYIQKAIRERSLRSDIEGYIVDRIKIGKGQKQLYGTQFFFNKKLQRLDIYPIEDRKNVDKRRERIGLYPLKRDLKNYGIISDGN